MMLLEIAEAAAENARLQKEEKVQRAKHGAEARGDQVSGHERYVAVDGAGHHHADEFVAAERLDERHDVVLVDVLTWTHETWSTSTPHNPVTGRPWGAGEMQELAEHHDGVAKGWISDCLWTVAVNRAGDAIAVSQKYAVTWKPALSRYELTWTERMVLDPGQPKAQLLGMIPQRLHAFMNEMPADTFLHRAGLTADRLEMTPEQATAHLDCTTVLMMSEVIGTDAIAVLAAEPNSERATIIRRRLGRQVLGG